MRNSNIFLLFACLLILDISCKKSAIHDEVNNNSVIEAQLFNLSEVNDAEIIEVANQIKQEGKEKNFLKYFLENNGTPLWSNATKKGGNEMYIVVIPFVREKSKEVDGFIVAMKNKGNNFSLSLFRKDFLKKYGFSSSEKLNATDVQVMLNYFNHKIFNKTTFSLQNAMQVPVEIRRKHDDIHPYFLVGHIKNISANTENEAFRTTSSFCFDVSEEVEWWHDPDGTSDPCHCSGNEYYLYTVTEVMTICVDLGGGGGYVDSGGWWIGDPVLGGGGGGGGGGPYYTTEQKLNALLGPGDSYYFVNNDPNMPQEPWEEEPVNYGSVEAFEAAIKNYKFETSISFDQGDEKVLNARIGRVLFGGYDIKVKIKKNSSNIYEVQNVTSDEYGNTLGWSWTQSQYTVNVGSEIIQVDIWGKEKYNIFLEGIGTVYSKEQHYRIMINKLTGKMTFVEKI
jgi:hypothetical protein